MGYFGAAGLEIPKIERALRDLQTLKTPYGMNLIHSPNEPKMEAETVELYLREGVRFVEASAYMDLTLPLVRFRVAGIARDAEGRVHTPQRVMAKISRTEVARRFFSPPPSAMLEALVREGFLRPEQAVMASEIPMADEVTAEADSGGHTDNRPALSLFPTICALRDQMQQRYGEARILRVGAAGGIGTPDAAAAMFAMGAAYIVTGSINQACVESGSSEVVRALLAQAEQADVIMAPAADMFEMGVKVQVLKRGTMFAMRASKLFTLYRDFPSLEAIPAKEREILERQIFQAPLLAIWEQTQAYFAARDASQLERAAQDPKHKMALVFRWYLGLSSRWANQGDPTRKLDYQIWTGPAMGAFNAWAEGSVLAQQEHRRVVDVALNILYGAAYQTRLQWLRQQGLAGRLGSFPPYRPIEREALLRLLARSMSSEIG
jgi:PfaD family protein